MSEREAQGCTPPRASRTLSHHTFTHTRTHAYAHPVHPDRGLSPSQTHSLLPSGALRICLGEPDGEEGFHPGSVRDLQQHAPAEPDFIPRLSGALQQATREEWIVERAGRGTEGSLRAFASSEDALGIAAGRLRVRRILVDACCRRGL